MQSSSGKARRHDPERVSDGEVRFVVLGDVRGQFSHAARAARAGARSVGGRVDLLLCTGDMEPNRDARDAACVPTAQGHRRWVGEFPQVVSGRISFPAPLYFVGGDHEPWAALDAIGPGLIAPGVHFLGRAGVRNLHGLRVAFLSGVVGDATSSRLCDRIGRDERACYVEAELTIVERVCGRDGPVDLLVTHDWPAGGIDGRGDRNLRDLDWRIEPPLHVCGHHRERASGRLDRTQVEALAEVSSDGGWAGFVRHRDGRVELVDAG